MKIKKQISIDEEIYNLAKQMGEERKMSFSAYITFLILEAKKQNKKGK